MQFISGTFILFLPALMAVYFLIRPKCRYLVLLAANYVFYGWNNLTTVPVLLASTAWTYLGGKVLEKSKRKLWYGLFFAANILVLLAYKYMDFFIMNLNRGISAVTGGTVAQVLSPVNLIAPIGLSFYIFQSSSYLSDVYRKGMAPERNFLKYAAFVSFFPTVLSGPIQRSRDLLPQLNAPKNPHFDQARRGLLLFVWGVFEKLAVANNLAGISTSIFNGYLEYDGAHLILAAVCFSLYIYSDFSSYSDMACGIANMLGFDIKPNFRNPYLAQTLSDFWNRWHMSLNTWFVENIYIPLGGNRKGVLRKYFNIMMVFLVSGIWHGASWHFIVWGVLNGILRVAGEILLPARKRLYQRLKIDYDCAVMALVRRGIVFALITLTWVFFTVPGCRTAAVVILKMLQTNPVQFINPALMYLAGSRRETLMVILSVIFFLFVQYRRREEGKFYTGFAKLPAFVQQVCIAVTVVICVVLACAGTTTLNTQFIYFQF